MEIGDEVIFGPYVVISTGTHTFKDGSVKRGGTIMSKVAIGRGSWLAAHASVRAGSSVGSGVIVGANAVVTKDTEDNVVVGGVPAKVLGPRRDAEEGVDVKYSRF
jgi:acetyltransferase-like isoleucine patch superfamily enzyme